MPILDCLCLNGDPGADEMCHQHYLSGGKEICGFRYRCDRCQKVINLSGHEESPRERHAEMNRFLGRCGTFAHCHKTTYRSTLLQDEFRGTYCDDCMVALEGWAPAMADILYLKAEVSRLYRSILDVKKDRNNRAAT